MSTRERRRLLLVAGAVLLALGAGWPSLDRRLDLSASPDTASWERIRTWRAQGRYGEALREGRKLLASESRDARAPAWRRQDAARLVATLERIAAWPESTRRELARADGADSTIRVLTNRGHYRQAVALARGQWQLRARVLGEDSPEAAASLGALARLSMLRGDAAEARSLCQRTLEIHRRVLGRTHPEVAVDLDALGLAEQLLADLAGADSCFEQAYAIRRRLFGAVHPSLALSLNRRADLRRRSWHGEQAEAGYRQAWRMLEATSRVESPEAAEVLCNLGLIAYQRGEFRVAEVHSRRAVEILARLPEASLETRALGTSVLGASLWRLRSFAEAEPVLRESARAYEVLHAQGEPGRPPFHALGVYVHLALDQLELGKPDLAWQSMERSLNRATLDLLRPPPPMDGVEPEDLPEDPRFGSVAQVQAHLSEHTAIIGWLSGFRSSRPIWDYPIWAYVVRRRGPVRWVRVDRPSGADDVLGTDSMYEVGLAQMREAAWPARVPFDPERLRKLEAAYRDLMTPLEPYLAGVTQLVVVRAELNASFNVEAVVDPRGRYLGERYDISYTPSSSLYLWMREHALPRRPAPGWRVLAVGDPQIGSDSDPEGRSSSLPGSREEIRDLVSLFPGTMSLVGREASPRNLSRLAASGRLQEFDLIHFALHLRDDISGGGQMEILLSPSSEEAPPSGRNGRIGPNEILRDWSLRADLVTVSACRSGRCIAGTEALTPISQALLGAGAHSLLVASWDIDDQATALLMRRFYRDLTGDPDGSPHRPARAPMSKVRALREARTWLRNYRDLRGRQPYENPLYWGAFTLLGDVGDD